MRNVLRQPALWIIIILSGLNMWLWLGCKDYSCLESENAKHLIKAYSMYRQWLENGFSLDSLNTITYPPIFYVGTCLLFKMLGHSSESLALFSVFPYMALSALAVFDLVCRLSHDRRLALVAGVTMLGAMQCSLQNYGYLIEYSTLAWVSLAYCLFLRSRSLTRLPWALAFGFCCGLGLLTKWTLPAYFIVPALQVLYSLVCPQRSHCARRSVLLGLGLALAALLITAAPWYLSQHQGHANYQELLGHFSHSRASELAGFAQGNGQANFRASLPGWLQFGPLALGAYLCLKVLPPYLSLALFLGALNWLLSMLRPQRPSLRRPMPEQLLLWLSLASIGVFFSFYPATDSFTPEKTLRHLAPATGLLFAVSFVWMERLKNGWPRLTIILLHLALGFLALIAWIMPAGNALAGTPLLWPGPVCSQRLSFQDPLGLLSQPKTQTIETAARRMAQLTSQGCRPQFSFNLAQDYQPILAEFYNACPLHMSLPAVYERNRQGNVFRLSLTEQAQEPCSPPAQPLLQIKQRYLSLSGLSRQHLNPIDAQEVQKPAYQRLSPRLEVFRARRADCLDKYTIILPAP